MALKKRIKPRNPIAKVLQFFTSKRFTDKSKFTRKIKYKKIEKKGRVEDNLFDEILKIEQKKQMELKEDGSTKE